MRYTVDRDLASAGAPEPTARAGALVGYARVSTRGQDLASQVAALEAAGCVKVFQEKHSVRGNRQPELRQAIGYCRPGDTLTVTRLSRLTDGITPLVALALDLERQGVSLRSLQEGLNLHAGNAADKLLFNMLGVLNQFRLDLIREHTLEGLEAARAKGRKGGRPRKVTDKVLRDALAMMRGGASQGQAARALGVSPQALSTNLARYRAGLDQEVTM